MHPGLLLLLLAVHGARAALCDDSVTLCSDATQFCCCTGATGPPVCTCCLNATEMCAAGVCLAASASPTPSTTPSSTPSGTASPTPAPTIGTSATRTASPSPSASPSRTASPTRTASSSPSASPTRTASPSCPAASGGATVVGCNGTTLVLAPGSVLVVPIVLNGTQIVTSGSLGVATSVSFGTDAVPVRVLNGSLALLPGGSVVVAVAADDNRTRIVLFEADTITVDTSFTTATDSACTEATADTATPGQFAVLLVPSGACGRRHDSAVGAWPWILLGVGGAACICAIVCAVTAVAGAMLAIHHGFARSALFHDREAPDDSIMASHPMR